MTKISLRFSFFLALAAFLFSTAFFPSIRLIHFAPFLALTFQRKSLLPSLWMATGCGLLMDLFASNLRFGFFSFLAALTTFFCHRFRRFFFEEKKRSLPLFTALISSVFSFLHLLFVPSLFTGKTLLGSCIVFPILDALYAFFWFCAPLLFYDFFTRRITR